jgi:hypothetical protein
MPRRGEHAHDFRPDPSPVAQTALAQLGGLWEFTVATAHGRTAVIKVDTTKFACRRLADELVLEMREYALLKRLHPTMVYNLRRAVLDLCAFVDGQAGAGGAACSLAWEEPDAGALVREWMRRLPEGFAENSTRPALLAGCVMTLLRFRGRHPDRALSSGVQRMLRAPARVNPGRSRELEEFTRAEKRALVAAAWKDVRELQERLAEGARLRAAGADPRTHGWLSAANLVYGLAEGLVTPGEIWPHLPHYGDWPVQLHELLDRAKVRFCPNTSKYLLTIAAAGMIYPRNIDLQAFRVLLVAETGHAPEEVAFLTEDEVEFVPGGVALTLVKRRAAKIRRREFTDGGRSEALHNGKTGATVAEIVKILMEVTAEARARVPGPRRYLFTRANVMPGQGQGAESGQLRIRVFEPVGRGGGLDQWVKRAGVGIEGLLDIRRLRKASKVEKVIAFRGAVHQAADDHTEQVFWGHYAHGTTLRVIAGNPITAAQQHWLNKALVGPVLLDAAAAGRLAEPEVARGLGLDAGQAEQIIQGELDMGVSSCRDPYDSPYSPTGTLCMVAPLRCLECRNAFVLPSNLPQLLLFAEHLDKLSARLDPRVFHQTWGQSRANLRAVLAEAYPAEIERARGRPAETGGSLQLPLSALVEFD